MLYNKGVMWQGQRCCLANMFGRSESDVPRADFVETCGCSLLQRMQAEMLRRFAKIMKPLCAKGFESLAQVKDAENGVF